MAATFLTDEQTLQDIQIRDSRNRSIFDFFDQAVTEGGQHFLHQLFYSPQLDVQYGEYVSRSICPQAEHCYWPFVSHPQSLAG